MIIDYICPICLKMTKLNTDDACSYCNAKKELPRQASIPTITYEYSVMAFEGTVLYSILEERLKTLGSQGYKIVVHDKRMLILMREIKS